MTDYPDVTQDEWDQVPDATAKPPNKWDDLLDQIAQGKMKRIPYSDGTDKRGIRISLGRRAAQRGITLTIKTADDSLLVRQSAGAPPASDQPDAGPEEGYGEDEPVAPIAVAATPKASRSRRSRQPAPAEDAPATAQAEPADNAATTSES